MESYNHIHFPREFKCPDVPRLKTEFFVAVFLREGVAVFNNILFKVKADNFRIDIADVNKEMVEDKGKV